MQGLICKLTSDVEVGKIRASTGHESRESHEKVLNFSWRP
jgi:hypothetical protein